MEALPWRKFPYIWQGFHPKSISYASLIAHRSSLIAALIFGFWLFLPINHGLAQTSLFTVTSSDSLSLATANDSLRYNALTDTTAFSGMAVVSTVDFRSSITNDTTGFFLPVFGDTVWAEAIRIVDDTATQTFRWSGRLLNDHGYVSLMQDGASRFGFMQIRGRYFELQRGDGQYQYLVERKNNVIDVCGNQDSVVNAGPGPGPGCDFPVEYVHGNTCPAIVTVLLVITPLAKDWILTEGPGDIETFAKIGEEQVNLALLNSEVWNKEIRVIWMEKSEFDPELTTDIIKDQKFIDVWLSQERLNFGADAAVLVTNQGYLSPGGGVVTGAAYEISAAFDEAFALVEAPYFSSYFTFAHELGHLFGGRHNYPANLGNDDSPDCAHAWRQIFIKGPNLGIPGAFDVDSWYTMVSNPVAWAGLQEIEDDNGDEIAIEIFEEYRILHYSNPEVYAGGPSGGIGATGREDANNANWFRNHMCAMADFIPTQDFALFLSLESDCYDDPITFTADIHEPGPGQPGVGPYTVSWRWNTSGIFSSGNFTSLGSGNQITLTVHPACPVYYIQCVVESDDHIVINRIVRVDLRDYPLSDCDCTTEGGGEELRISKLGYVPGAEPSKLQVLPNPVAADQAIQIRFEEAANEEVIFSILDVSGKQRHSRLVRLDHEGTGRLSGLGLPSGYYQVQGVLPNGKAAQTTLIIVNP